MYKSNPRTHQNDHSSWSNKHHPRDVGMVQYTEIYQNNPRQTKSNKKYDHFFRYWKNIWQSSIFLHDKVLKLALKETDHSALTTTDDKPIANITLKRGKKWNISNHKQDNGIHHLHSYSAKYFNLP